MRPLLTERLELVPANAALVQASLDDAAVLARLLTATVPTDWPPEYFDADAHGWLLEKADDGRYEGWTAWFIVTRGPPRALAGIVGYTGPPSADGAVEIGYALCVAHRARGFATEAARALVGRAFEDARTRRVVAETFPHLTASIRVMERCGMRPAGDGRAPGTVRWSIDR
ncbi:MAG: GNAT family N-acetyltransferase [Methanobacteriota archaeon]